MTTPNDIANALPRPHPREPRDLRRDIADEIADHMQEATQRELECGAADDVAAYELAVATFGDPKAVARRLWWDAMKETIMREWIQTGIMAVMALCVVGFMGVAYSAMRDQHTALLGLLQGGQSSDTRAFEFVVTRGTTNGDPVDAAISVRGNAIRADDSIELWYGTDSNGTVTTDNLLLGSYRVQLRDKASGFVFEEFEFPLFPGDGPAQHTFVAPALDDYTVAFTSDLPLERMWAKGHFLRMEVYSWTEHYFLRRRFVFISEQGVAAFVWDESPANPMAEDIDWQPTVTFTGGTHLVVGDLRSILDAAGDRARDIREGRDPTTNLHSFRADEPNWPVEDKLIEMSETDTNTVTIPIDAEVFAEYYGE